MWSNLYRLKQKSVNNSDTMGKKCKTTASFDRIHSSETLENDDYNQEIPAHQKSYRLLLPGGT